MIARIFGFFSMILLLSFNAFSQDEPSVTVYPQHGQTVSQENADKNDCYNVASGNVKQKKHRTLKNGAIGAGIGAVGGKIIGKPGAGAVIGAGAGAYKGHRGNKKEDQKFNESYAACLRDRGYEADVSH